MFRLASCVAVLSVWATAAQAVTIHWVTVGDPDNVADTEVMTDGTTGYGSVADVYQIGKYEVTNGQYCEFLNAVAANDPNHLYHTAMGGGWNDIGGIARSGSLGSYTYTVRPNRRNRPVNYVSFYDACRFANWLNNGQPGLVTPVAQDDNSTEDGAYDMSRGSSVVRKPVQSPFSQVRMNGTRRPITRAAAPTRDIGITPREATRPQLPKCLRAPT